MTELRLKLGRWLSANDDHLQRFSSPIPIKTVAQEAGASAKEILDFLQATPSPVYHVWRHGSGSRSKPYCLRLNGPETVGLDWEESVIGAAQAELRRRGYRTVREFGTPAQVRTLAANPDLSMHKEGKNLRDLWALRRDGKRLNLYIIEAKGKQAFEFDYYCFAEVLSQVFVVSGEHLTALLGTRKGPGHGLCWQYAQYLSQNWRDLGYEPTITVAVLVPEWSPDVVWKGSKLRQIPDSFFSRPLSTFHRFLETGETETISGRYKYQRAFGAVLDELQKNLSMRSLVNAQRGLRFRVLAARQNERTKHFELAGLSSKYQPPPPQPRLL